MDRRPFNVTCNFSLTGDKLEDRRKHRLFEEHAREEVAAWKR